MERVNVSVRSACTHNVSLKIHYRANLPQIPTEKSTVRESIGMEKQFLYPE